MNQSKESKMPTRGMKLGVQILFISIPTLITIIVPILIDKFQAREPKLEFTLTPNLPSPGGGENSRLQYLKIKNTGRGPADDFKATLAYPGQIENTRVGRSPAIDLEPYSLDSSTFMVIGNMLNPTDSVSILCQTSTKTPLTENMIPIVDVRARGVVGKQVEQWAEREGRWNTQTFLIIIGLLVSFIVMFWLRRTKSPRRTDESGFSKRTD